MNQLVCRCPICAAQATQEDGYCNHCRQRAERENATGVNRICTKPPLHEHTHQPSE